MCSLLQLLSGSTQLSFLSKFLLLTMLGTELPLSSKGRMTLGVEEILWFISHTLPQYHALQGVGDTYL
jgi:hypothetical protein